jgi:hypothetical protein
MAQNGPKWLEMPKKAQKVPKWPKMAQNGANCPKFATLVASLKCFMELIFADC